MYLGEYVRERKGKSLMCKDRSSEKLSRPAVLAREIDRLARQPETDCRDEDTADTEHGQDLLQPVTASANHIRFGQPDVVEKKLDGIRRSPADLWLALPEGEAGRADRQEERREAIWAHIRIGDGDDSGEIMRRGAGVCGEHFGSVQHEITAVFHCACPDVCDIGTAMWFSNTEGANEAAFIGGPKLLLAQRVRGVAVEERGRRAVTDIDG